MEIDGTKISLLEPSATGISIVSSGGAGEGNTEVSGIISELLGSKAELFFSKPGGSLVLKLDGSIVQGWILSVHKELIYISNSGSAKKLSPLCVVDYKNLSSREDTGKELFDAMLKFHSLAPHLVAFDNPSQETLQFIDKHYKLRDFEPQKDQIVLFKEYFQTHRKTPVKIYKAANERRRPDSAQRTMKGPSQTRRSLEPARIPPANQNKKNLPPMIPKNIGGEITPWLASKALPTTIRPRRNDKNQ